MFDFWRKWIRSMQNRTELTVEEVSEKYPKMTKNRIYYLMRKGDKRFKACIVPNRTFIFIDEDKLVHALDTYPDLAKGKIQYAYKK